MRVTMAVGRIAQMRSGWWPTLLALLALLAFLSAACTNQPACPAGLQSYEGNCLSGTIIQYVGCTEQRGVSLTTQMRIQGAAGGSFRAVADASVNIAYRRTELDS